MFRQLVRWLWKLTYDNLMQKLSKFAALLGPSNWMLRIYHDGYEPNCRWKTFKQLQRQMYDAKLFDLHKGS